MNFISKAEALCAAWKRQTGAMPPQKQAVLLALAQADLETHCGDDWPTAHNWGACDYRPLTVQEHAAFTAGSLKAGDWLFPDSSHSSVHQANAIAVLHVDTTPTPSGPKPYPMWFAAFPDDVGGAAYYLHVLLPMLGASVFDPNLTAQSWATACYMHGYFEGTVPGARPIRDRVVPLNSSELANIERYCVGMQARLPGIVTALSGWDLPSPTEPAA